MDPVYVTESGITALPTELLIEVFSLALIEHYHPRIRHLLLVCKRWKNVILNAPDLWTEIYLIFSSRDDLDFIKAYYNACSERSGTNLLKVSIDVTAYIVRYTSPHTSIDDPDGSVEIDDIETDPVEHDRWALYDILLKAETPDCTLSRWRYLYVKTPRDGMFRWYRNHPLGCLFKLRTPNLISLTISEGVHEIGEYDSDMLPHFVIFSSIVNATVTSYALALRLYPRSSDLKSLDFTYARQWSLAHIDSFSPLYEMSSLESLVLRVSPRGNMTSYTPGKSRFTSSPRIGYTRVGWLRTS
jgi:hypothetical protein